MQMYICIYELLSCITNNYLLMNNIDLIGHETIFIYLLIIS